MRDVTTAYRSRHTYCFLIPIIFLGHNFFLKKSENKKVGHAEPKSYTHHPTTATDEAGARVSRLESRDAGSIPTPGKQFTRALGAACGFTALLTPTSSQSSCLFHPGSSLQVGNPVDDHPTVSSPHIRFLPFCERPAGWQPC